MAHGRRREPTALYQAAVQELADGLGWRAKDIWFHFQQLAWLLEFECHWPREVAEFKAHHYVLEIFDKRGVRPS
jgi:hypothetical protein